MVDSSNEDELQFESRTQKKHFAHSMVDLARDLVSMKPSARNQLPIDEHIISAINDAKNITSHIAKKRHFQFLGKLLLNANHQEIVQAMQESNQQKDAAKLRTSFLNLWLEQALEENFDLNTIYSSYDSQSIQTLRQLIRSAKKSGPQAEKHKKKLFQHLRKMDQKTPLP